MDAIFMIISEVDVPSSARVTFNLAREMGFDPKVGQIIQVAIDSRPIQHCVVCLGTSIDVVTPKVYQNEYNK